jgi:hypothetical protein
MPVDPLKICVIAAKDEDTKTEILNAFAAHFENPIDPATGLPRDNPEQLVKRQVKKFIRSILVQARYAAKKTALGEVVLPPNDFTN